MAKVTLHLNPTDSLSSLSYEALAVNIKDYSILPFVPKGEKSLQVVYVYDVYDISTVYTCHTRESVYICNHIFTYSTNPGQDKPL